MTQQTPPPSSDQGTQQTIADLKQGLFNSAFPVLVQKLEAHKTQHGLDALDRGAIAEAMMALAQFLAGNGRFVVGPDTDLLINVGIEVISAAAAQAKKKVEEKRIILLR